MSENEKNERFLLANKINNGLADDSEKDKALSLVLISQITEETISDMIDQKIEAMAKLLDEKLKCAKAIDWNNIILNLIKSPWFWVFLTVFSVSIGANGVLSIASFIATLL